MDEKGAAALLASQAARETSLSAPARCPFFPRAIALSVTPNYALAECAAALPGSSATRLLVDFSSPSLRTGMVILHSGRGPPSQDLG
jgi:hypothetical protein